LIVFLFHNPHLPPRLLFACRFLGPFFLFGDLAQLRFQAQTRTTEAGRLAAFAQASSDVSNSGAFPHF